MLQLRASVFANPSVCGDWRLNTTGMHRAGFHLVARGACWLHTRDQPAPVSLRAGDLVFVSGDCWHVLGAKPQLDGDDTRLSETGDGPRTDLICGSVDFGEAGAEAFLRALPEFVLLRSDEEVTGGGLETLARLMAGEARTAGVGRRVALDRLADVLFVQILRHVTSLGLVRGGPLAALADPGLSRVLTAIHAQPGAPWTLASLARLARMSRSTFAERFVGVVRDTPLQYLARWRMQEAERLLRDRRRSVAQVAEIIGYGTEAAFRRAFKRVRGIAPGEVRRLLLQDPATE